MNSVIFIGFIVQTFILIYAIVKERSEKQNKKNFSKKYPTKQKTSTFTLEDHKRVVLPTNHGYPIDNVVENLQKLEQLYVKGK